MKIHNTKKRQMVFQWLCKLGIGFGILIIVIQLINIAKMLIWGA